MGYSLDDYVRDCRALLSSGQPLSESLTAMGVELSKLLRNPAFVKSAFSEDMAPGKRVLHHDRERDFYVLAHVQAPGKAGKPHSHGNSWAIYGNARGFTDMTEWRRTNPDSADAWELAVSEKYRLGPGDTRGYGPGVIHSTAHPEPAWVIRVTGTDLDVIPRYHFKASRDRMLESA